MTEKKGDKMVKKKKFRGNQFTACSKKIYDENPGHVSASNSKIDNSCLVNEANK